MAALRAGRALFAHPKFVGPKFEHLLVSHPPARVICRSSHFADDMLPNEREQPPNVYSTSVYSGTTYTDTHGRVYNVHPLSENKRKLNVAFDACDVSQNFRALMVSIAMQESAHADIALRDETKGYFKDGARNPAGNATIFNLSVDLIDKTGYYGSPLTEDQFNYLNCGSNEALRDAVRILKLAFERWGIENTLAFVRGGGSAFDETKSRWDYYTTDVFDGNEDHLYRSNTHDYLCAIKTFLHELDEHPEYFTDDHRPDIWCRHLSS